jgi:hypothetical protein
LGLLRAVRGRDVKAQRLGLLRAVRGRDVKAQRLGLLRAVGWKLWSDTS